MTTHGARQRSTAALRFGHLRGFAHSFVQVSVVFAGNGANSVRSSTIAAPAASSCSARPVNGRRCEAARQSRSLPRELDHEEFPPALFITTTLLLVRARRRRGRSLPRNKPPMPPAPAEAPPPSAAGVDSPARPAASCAGRRGPPTAASSGRRAVAAAASGSQSFRGPSPRDDRRRDSRQGAARRPGIGTSSSATRKTGFTSIPAFESTSTETRSSARASPIPSLPTAATRCTAKPSSSSAGLASSSPGISRAT